MTIFGTIMKKYIEISTNIPGIGFVIPEITCEMLE